MSPLLLALALAGAAAPEPELRSGFSPHPFLADLAVQTGVTSMKGRGYGSCSTAPTSDEPAFAFTLPEGMGDLRLVVDAPAVLVQPDGAFVCVKEAPVWLKDWKPGRYQVLLHGSGPELTAKLRLEQPARAAAEVQAALLAAPEIVLSSSSPGNPTFHSLKPGLVFRARSSGVGCGPETLAPLARVKVAHASSWSFAVREGGTVLLIGASGGCRTDLRSARLEAGDYVLWAAPGSSEAEAAAWSLAVADEGRPLLFPQAPTYDLGALKKPVALAGEVQPAGWMPAGWGACAALPAAPSFYVKGADALRNVELRAWKDAGLGDKLRFHLFGPMEDPRPGRTMRCDQPRPTFRELRGTWAVFVTAEGAAKQVVTSLAYRVDLPIDPLTAPLSIPESLPVEQRALPDHFPFFREGLDVRRFFLKAPLGLFTATEDGDGPLLVVGSRQGETGRWLDVLRYSGAGDLVQAAKAQPKAGAPKTPFLAKKGFVVETLAEALAAAGPAEDAAVGRYRAVEAEVNRCAHEWLLKNDPDWAKGEELLPLGQGGPRPERLAKADATCKVQRLEAAAKALVKQVNAGRNASEAAYVAGLKKRFK